MTSYEKITRGISLAGEGMAEVITMWGRELEEAAQKMVEAWGLDKWGDEDDLILAKGYIAGVISYSVATRSKGRRRKKWVNTGRKKLGRQR